MTANDLAALEAAHGLPLPGRYRELMLSYPFDAADPNAANALWSDARQIRAMNNEMRTGEFRAEWKADRFVIGCSPFGDTFFLDLTGASPAVFIWDHETHAIAEEAPDLDQFVAAWRGASPPTQTPAPTAAQRSWWQFWK